VVDAWRRLLYVRRVLRHGLPARRSAPSPVPGFHHRPARVPGERHHCTAFESSDRAVGRRSDRPSTEVTRMTRRLIAATGCSLCFAAMASAQEPSTTELSTTATATIATTATTVPTT